MCVSYLGLGCVKISHFQVKNKQMVQYLFFYYRDLILVKGLMYMYFSWDGLYSMSKKMYFFYMLLHHLYEVFVDRLYTWGPT